MNIHKNARLTPHGRERIVLEVLRGQTPQAASRAAGVCAHTVRKWVARYQAEGEADVIDRATQQNPAAIREDPRYLADNSRAVCRFRWVRGDQALLIHPRHINRHKCTRPCPVFKEITWQRTTHSRSIFQISITELKAIRAYEVMNYNEAARFQNPAAPFDGGCHIQHVMQGIIPVDNIISARRGLCERIGQVKTHPIRNAVLPHQLPAAIDPYWRNLKQVK
ncbi:leucine zipper domain-containing protein [Mesorhizobium sp. YC-39]|nr:MULTISPECIES: leucine zipper domain-containing protein [unclassified Mesorhizobium]MCV3210527.1 leucine zipper domain-containing protein [Mesorhizobium sp. YC-2]MCV3232575.1 leucine zipper domain-containing protein [Mesorhizobium sp. YC-39]